MTVTAARVLHGEVVALQEQIMVLKLRAQQRRQQQQARPEKSNIITPPPPRSARLPFRLPRQTRALLLVVFTCLFFGSFGSAWISINKAAETLTVDRHTSTGEWNTTGMPSFNHYVMGDVELGDSTKSVATAGNMINTGFLTIQTNELRFMGAADASNGVWFHDDTNFHQSAVANEVELEANLWVTGNLVAEDFRLNVDTRTKMELTALGSDGQRTRAQSTDAQVANPGGLAVGDNFGRLCVQSNVGTGRTGIVDNSDTAGEMVVGLAPGARWGLATNLLGSGRVTVYRTEAENSIAGEVFKNFAGTTKSLFDVAEQASLDTLWVRTGEFYLDCGTGVCTTATTRAAMRCNAAGRCAINLVRSDQFTGTAVLRVGERLQTFNHVRISGILQSASPANWLTIDANGMCIGCSATPATYRLNIVGETWGATNDRFAASYFQFDGAHPAIDVASSQVISQLNSEYLGGRKGGSQAQGGQIAWWQHWHSLQYVSSNGGQRYCVWIYYNAALNGCPGGFNLAHWRHHVNSWSSTNQFPSGYQHLPFITSDGNTSGKANTAAAPNPHHTRPNAYVFRHAHWKVCCNG